MSNDTLDGILAAALAAAVFALLFVAGIWATEAHAERVTMPATHATEYTPTTEEK